MAETRESTGDEGAFYATLLPILRLTLFGDFDLFFLDGTDTVFVQSDDGGQWVPQDPAPGPNYAFVHFIFFISSIGITGSNYERFEDRSRELFVGERANMIVSIKARPWKRIWEWKCSGTEATEPDQYLLICSRADGNEEDVRSVRSAMQQSMDALEERLSSKLDNALASLAKITEITKQEGPISTTERQGGMIPI